MGHEDGPPQQPSAATEPGPEVGKAPEPAPRRRRSSAAGELRRVVLLGATGATGRLVARELAAAGTPFLLASRTREALRRLSSELGGPPVAVADARQPDTVADLLRPGDVLASCAGPFTDLGEAVIGACLERRAHYLDSTGEQGFMARVAGRADRPAREAGVAVAPAVAFEYALGDAAATAAARRLPGRARSAELVYGWRGGAGATSPGTRRSLLRTLAAKGLVLEEGEWREEPAGRHARVVTLPDGSERRAVSFPAGEAVTLPRHLDVKEVRAWIVVGGTLAALLPRVAPVLPAVVRLGMPLLDPILRRAGPEVPGEEARRESRFEIVATVRGEGEASREGSAGSARREESRRAVVRGRDPYGLTGVILARAARRLLEEGPACGHPGVLAPSQVTEPEELLDGLADRGLEWEVG